MADFVAPGGIDRKVRTAFLKFRRGNTEGEDAGLEFRDRLRKTVGENWMESIRRTAW